MHEVKQDSMAKARHLLADQNIQFEKTAQHYEQVARDEVTAQVAHNKAELMSEAMSVIGEKDKRRSPRLLRKWLISGRTWIRPTPGPTMSLRMFLKSNLKPQMPSLSKRKTSFRKLKKLFQALLRTLNLRLLTFEHVLRLPRGTS